MMKSLRNIGKLFLGVLLFVSCFEDKGNYDYYRIAQPEVAGLKDTVIEKGGILRMNPAIIWDDEGLKPEELSYTWTAEKIERGSESYEKYVIGHNLILNDTIWLDVRKDPYLVTLTVRDEKRDIEYRSSFKLSVQGRIAEGFLFLTEDHNRKAELDIYARKSTGESFLEKGILSRSGFPYLGGGANCVVYKVGSNPVERQIWIATGEATGYIDDFVNFKWKERNMAKYMFLYPVPVSYTFKHIVLATFRNLIFFNEEGKAHRLDDYGVISSNIATSGTEEFQAWPGCGVEMAIGQVGTPGRQILIYDQTNKKFWNFASSASACKDLPEKEAAKGMELIYMQSVLTGKRTIALLKDSVDVLWQYNYVINNRSLTLQSAQKMLNPGNIEEAKEKGLFICDNTYGYIYYAIGNQLYNYREGEGCVPVGTPFDAPIVCMQTLNLSTFGKPDYYKNYNQSFVVATYSDATKGKAYLFKPNKNESKELIPYGDTITDLGRVKSISYLEK